MKKLILIMLCMLLLVGTVSASDLVGFDNYIEFDESIGDYGKIEVWDYGEIFDSKKLAETILERNDDCLIDCDSTGTKTIYETAKLFESFEFYDKKGNRLDLDYELYYWVEDLEVKIVNDYDCIEKELENKSIVNDCSKIKGTHEEYTSGWKLYDWKTLSPGTYQWKLEVNKPLGVDVDWVAVAENGIKYTSWAWYLGSWSYRKNMSNLNGTVSFVKLLYSNFTHANANFSDLEFVNNATNDTYDFWISNKTDSSWAEVYIETNGDSDIMVYYGNANKGTPSHNFTDVYPDIPTKYGAYTIDDGSGDKIMDVYKVVNGTTYTLIQCTGDPGFLDRDEKGRIHFIINFNLQRR